MYSVINGKMAHLSRQNLACFLLITSTLRKYKRYAQHILNKIPLNYLDMGHQNLIRAPIDMPRLGLSIRTGFRSYGSVSRILW